MWQEVQKELQPQNNKGKILATTKMQINLKKSSSKLLKQKVNKNKNTLSTMLTVHTLLSLLSSLSLLTLLYYTLKGCTGLYWALLGCTRM